jgi:pyridoxine 5-phosphate synthase
MTRLSVNVNKLATLRNARGGNNPDLLSMSKDIERFGAHGITIHPRPDERHIRKSDVIELNKIVSGEFNIEGYPSKEFISMVLDIKPDQVTLVPDSPEVLTSNAGWDTIKHKSYLKNIISQFNQSGIRTSLFIEANEEMIKNAADTNTNRIELYTESYASDYPINKERAISNFVLAAETANKVGLGINAGHDLDLDNLAYFTKTIPGLLEVSIGHALICDALYYGIENTVQLYLRCLN